MTEIYNAFRMLLVVCVVGVIVYFGAQIIPQVQSAATLPAKIDAENARILQESKAAPTFVALSVQATASAIENERLRAQAEANAQTVAAQGIADAQRGQVSVLQSAVTGMVSVIAFLVAVFFVVAVVRAVFAARVHQHAVNEARRNGGRLELPNGHAVSFGRRESPKQLNAHIAENTRRVVNVKSAKRR